MKFYSTNNPALRVSLKEAIFNSLPLDKGLYMPERIPVLDDDFINHIEKFSLESIAFRVASALLGDDIPEHALREIVRDAINFEAPVKEISPNAYVLELFHGPSLAFKDFGARFMSRVMGYYLKGDDRPLDVLVATSGDTGGAVALGFLDVPNIRVSILYPKGKVSAIQELQLTTNGKNIRALEVDGTFDDCQALVKQAFSDEQLTAKYRLTSANSINIARLIPQTFYYFNAYAQLKKAGFRDVVFSVPSGNFGNIGAGLLACKMGLPVKAFVAATNINDTVPRFLETGVYEPKPSIQTYANAMDVGAPSNWTRIMDMFGQDREKISEMVFAERFTDQQTLNGILSLYNDYNYIACPHTAIAYLGSEVYRKKNPDFKGATVFLSTAHACKFPDIFPTEIAAKIEVPASVRELRDKPMHVDLLSARYEEFKAWLMLG